MGRLFLRTPLRHRRKTILLAQELRNASDKLEFLQGNTQLRPRLLEELRKLFDRRNRLVYLRREEVIAYAGGVIGFEEIEALVQKGRGRELDAAIEGALTGQPAPLQKLADEIGRPRTSLTLPGLSTEVVDEAEENLRIAEKVLKALRKELKLTIG